MDQVIAPQAFRERKPREQEAGWAVQATRQAVEVVELQSPGYGPMQIVHDRNHGSTNI